MTVVAAAAVPNDQHPLPAYPFFPPARARAPALTPPLPPAISTPPLLTLHLPLVLLSFLLLLLRVLVR